MDDRLLARLETMIEAMDQAVEWWDEEDDGEGAVGNQQKWDTFVKERSGGNGSVVGLPEQVVVAFAAG